MRAMIEVYSWPTPNGHKVHIMLEECGYQLGRDWRAHPIHIGQGDQFAPDFLRISPNNKIPALVDPDGPDGKPISLFESGAILIYLAEKTGKFLPKDPAQRYKTFEWLMWQMGGVGPMFGQAHHFLRAAPTKIEYGIKRYVDEAKRLYGVLDRQLDGRDYIAGEYSIADIATFPWTRLYQRQGLNMDDFPNVKRWHEAIAARPAVIKTMQETTDTAGKWTPEQWSVLFGDEQYKRR